MMILQRSILPTGIVASILSIAACLAITTLEGCGFPKQRVIGMVPKGSHHEFWQAVHAGADKAAAEYDFQIEWRAPESEADIDEQIRILDSLIEQQVTAISVAPIDRKALVPAVRKAAENKIPTSIFDSAIDTDSYISFVSTDNAAAGRLAARRMGKILGGKGSVAIVSFMPGSAATMAREGAFREELGLLFPLVKVVALQYGMADPSKAYKVTNEILAAHPDLSGIFCDNESSSIGAVRALRARGVPDIKLVAFDSSEFLLQNLKAGYIDSLVIQDAFRMGYEAVRVIAMKLGGSDPPVQVQSGFHLIAAKDLQRPDVQALFRVGAKR